MADPRALIVSIVVGVLVALGAGAFVGWHIGYAAGLEDAPCSASPREETSNNG